jgi:hypothetical protein
MESTLQTCGRPRGSEKKLPTSFFDSTPFFDLIPIADSRVLVRDEIVRVMLTHPKPRAVLAACYLIPLAWMEFLAFGVFFVLSAIDKFSIFESLSKITFIIFVATVCCYHILALRLYCPSCKRRFLLQTLGPKHPLARRILGMDYWATNAIDVIMHAEFTCMFCGEKCTVEELLGRSF